MLLKKQLRILAIFCAVATRNLRYNAADFIDPGEPHG